MRVTDTQALGACIRKQRKSQGLTQNDLAATAGVGIRFIIDLEKGKPSCQLNKTLLVLRMLGISVDLNGLADE